MSDQPSRWTEPAAVITELRLRSFAGGHKVDPFFSAAADLLMEMVEQRDTLGRALARTLLPLEALHAAATWELADAVKADIAEAVEQGRAALVGKGGGDV